METTKHHDLNQMPPVTITESVPGKRQGVTIISHCVIRVCRREITNNSTSEIQVEILNVKHHSSKCF